MVAGLGGIYFLNNLRKDSFQMNEGIFIVIDTFLTELLPESAKKAIDKINDANDLKMKELLKNHFNFHTSNKNITQTVFEELEEKVNFYFI